MDLLRGFSGVGAAAMSAAWGAGSFLANHALGFGLDRLILQKVARYLRLDPGAVIQLNPITVRTDSISLTSEMNDLIYGGTGLHIELSVQHLELSLQLSTQTAGAPAEDLDFLDTFYDANETPESETHPLFTLELPALRLSGVGLQLELRGLRVSVSAREWQSWQQAQLERSVESEGSPGEDDNEGGATASWRAPEGVSDAVGELLSRKLSGGIQLSLMGLQLLFHGHQNPCPELFPYKGSLGAAIDALEVSTPQCPPSAGWAGFVAQVQNLPLNGQLGALSVWLVDPVSVGPHGFLTARSEQEPCAVCVCGGPKSPVFEIGRVEYAAGVQVQLRHSDWSRFDCTGWLHGLEATVSQERLVWLDCSEQPCVMRYNDTNAYQAAHFQPQLAAIQVTLQDFHTPRARGLQDLATGVRAQLLVESNLEDLPEFKLRVSPLHLVASMSRLMGLVAYVQRDIADTAACDSHKGDQPRREDWVEPALRPIAEEFPWLCAMDVLVESAHVVLPFQDHQNCESLELCTGTVQLKSLQARRVLLSVIPEESFLSLKWLHPATGWQRSSVVHLVSDHSSLEATMVLSKQQNGLGLEVEVAGPGLEVVLNRSWTDVLLRFREMLMDSKNSVGHTIARQTEHSKAWESYFSLVLTSEGLMMEGCAVHVKIRLAMRLTVTMVEPDVGSLEVLGGGSVEIGPHLTLITLPEIRGQMAMNTVLYIVAFARMLEEKHGRDAMMSVLQETELRALGATVFSVQLPDRTLPMTNPTVLRIETSRGQATNLEISIPGLEAHAKASSDLEIHALNVVLRIKDFQSHASNLLLTLLGEAAPSLAPKLELEVCVARVTVESVFTFSGQVAPWLLLTTEDPKQPLLTHNKSVHDDTAVQLHLDQCYLNVFWSAASLKEALDVVLGIAKFTIPTTEDAIAAHMDRFRLDISNLWPSFAMLNSTNNIVLCGPFDSNWSVAGKTLWVTTFSFWFLFSFDMIAAIAGAAIATGVFSQVGCALRIADVGPCISDSFLRLAIAPVITLNLMMPAILHAFLGFYVKIYAVGAGLGFGVLVCWVYFMTEDKDWDDAAAMPVRDAVAEMVICGCNVAAWLISLFTVSAKGGCSGLGRFLSRDAQYLRCPWHHRVAVLAFAALLLLWVGIGGLVLFGRTGSDSGCLAECNKFNILFILCILRTSLGAFSLFLGFVRWVCASINTIGKRLEKIHPQSDQTNASTRRSFSIEIQPHRRSSPLSDPLLGRRNSELGRERFFTAPIFEDDNAVTHEVEDTAKLPTSWTELDLNIPLSVRAYFWFFVAVVATDIALSVFVSFSVDLTASHYDCEVCQFLWANQLLTYFIGTVLVFVVPATWLSMYLRAYSLKTREQAEWNDLRATSSTVVPYQPPQLAPHPDLCAADSVWLEWVLGTAPQYGLSLSSEKDQRVAIAAAKAGLWNVPNSRFRQLAELDSQWPESVDN